jgi:hypothetical protein
MPVVQAENNKFMEGKATHVNLVERKKSQKVTFLSFVSRVLKVSAAKGFDETEIFSVAL